MKKFNITLLLVTLPAVVLPYILAALAGGRSLVFTGFLLNPLDGASYLAKMQQGWSGAWRYTLPFSADGGVGAYLFLFYLFLGHLSRWVGLPLVWMYHLARIAGAVLLLMALFDFYDRIFQGQAGLYRIACWLTAAGSGMGWLVLFLGPPPADFWIAEAYPFLSMLANPHFPLGLALVVGSCSLLLAADARFRNLRLLLAGLLISIILPFGEVVVLMIGGAWAVWAWVESRRLEWQPLAALGLLGGPFLLYQFSAAQADPVLAVWNAQNLTPSPALYDFVISFSPALILAGLGVVNLWRCPGDESRRILIPWFVLGFVLIYLPTTLQRRFMLGYYIPTAALAVFGIDFLRQKYAWLRKRLVPFFFFMALPTNVLVILLAIFGIFSHAPEYYLSADESKGLSWIGQKAPAKALVLASPEISRWVPGLTGRRVVYGHPYETIHASQEEQWVSAFYADSGTLSINSLEVRGIDYVFYGPREAAMGGSSNLSALPVVFQSGQVRIYAVGGTP